MERYNPELYADMMKEPETRIEKDFGIDGMVMARLGEGLFKSSKGFINADLNGALNIIKKVLKDFNSSNLSIDFFKTVIKVIPKFTV